jgi:hypothetical protein
VLRDKIMLERIGWCLLYLSLSGCAATAANKTMNMQSNVSEIHYMGDAKLCYAFFTVKAMDEWYRYENTRRLRRLDCESYRKDVELLNKGKKINYEALNVTKLFRKSETGNNELARQPLLKDKQLNAICYVKIDDLIFAKRGQAEACQVQGG